MNFTENFEAVKNKAVGAAQAATQKAKALAAIAKANVSVYAEQDKIKKAEQQLGKLYYRDYAVGEEMDNAEYLPWCEKIDEAKQEIARLQDEIEALKADNADVAEEAEAAEEAVDVADEDLADEGADITFIEVEDKPEETPETDAE